MVTIQFQIVFKTKPHSKANTATKALKAVTKRQVFAISDKGGKDNDKAYDADIPQKGAHFSSCYREGPSSLQEAPLPDDWTAQGACGMRKH